MRSCAARRFVWLLTLGLCAGGAYVSWELTQRHIRSGFGEDSFLGRLCEEGAADCDQVIRSRWGTVLQTPTAVWGMTYFVGVGLWYLLVGLPNRRGRWWQALPILGTLGGVGIAGCLAYVMFATLPTWCPLCSITHGLSLLLFVASVLMWPRRPLAPVPGPAGGEPVVIGAGAAIAASGTEAAGAPGPTASSPSRPASPRPGRVLMGLITIAVAGAAVHADFWRRLHRAEEREARRALLEARTALAQMPVSRPAGHGGDPFTVRPDDAVAGDPQAPNTIVLYSDFECPICGGFASFWRREVEPYAKGKVRLVFRYFPMNTKCNSVVKTDLHARSCESAAIAEAARRLGGNAAFWKMHDELFINQLRREGKKLSTAELAAKVGLDAAQLEREAASEAVRRRIEADVAEAGELGMKATPVLFLNGRRVESAGPDPTWQAFLQSLKPTTAPATRHTGPTTTTATGR